MKHIVLSLLVALTATLGVSAQTPKKGASKFKKASVEIVEGHMVEVPATYPGGPTALLKDLSENLVYPPIAQEQELQGTIVLRFVVDTEGNIGNVQVKKSLSKECDQAAINALKKLKRFVPAKQKGKTVPVYFTLPVRFRLS